MRPRTRQTLTASAVMLLLLNACEKPTSLLGGASPSEALLGIRASVTGGPVPINRVLPCSGGGSIKLHGAAPNETNTDGTGRYAVNAVITPQNCRWTTTEGPIQLDGSPNLVLHSSRAVVRGVLTSEINGSLKGKATWRLSGRTIDCKIDATYRIDLNRPLSPTITGAECGTFLLKRFFALN
jgi:hypothetical protein